MEEFDKVKRIIKKIIGEIVGIDQFDDSDSLTDDLGYDSIDFMQLRSNLSNEFCIDITPQTWLDFIDEIQLNYEESDNPEIISSWQNKLAEYAISITPDMIETIKVLYKKNDLDSVSARIISLINVNTLSVLIIKLQKK